METKITSGYVSGDGHLVEPADLWTTHLDKRFRELQLGIFDPEEQKADHIRIDHLSPEIVQLLVGQTSARVNCPWSIGAIAVPTDALNLTAGLVVDHGPFAAHRPGWEIVDKNKVAIRA